MANKTISELTNAALPLAGTDKTIVSRDGVTLNDVLLSDLKYYIGTSGFVSTAFSTTLTFDGVNKEMIQQAVTGALAFTSSGSTIGSQINLCLVANGTNIPTFSTNFKEATGSSGYDNTANVKNYYQFIYTNNKVIYSTFQEVGDTGASDSTAPTLSSATVANGAATTLVLVFSEALDQTKALSAADFTLSGGKSDSSPVYTNATTVSMTVTAFTNGETITLDVAAGAVRDLVGNNIAAITARAITNNVAVAPSQVTGLTLGSATTTTQALTWTAPSANGSAITDYLVQYSTDNATWTTFADGTSTTASASVTGLTLNTLYYYRVAAVNAIGTGTYSASASGSTAAGATAPAQVTGLTLGAPTSTTQPLTWTAPANGGSAITDYLVEYKASASGTWLTFSDGTSATASATVTGLTASTAYDYRVSAINAIGTGTVSATVSGSTSAAASGNFVRLSTLNSVTETVNAGGGYDYTNTANSASANTANFKLPANTDGYFDFVLEITGSPNGAIFCLSDVNNTTGYQTSKISFYAQASQYYGGISGQTVNASSGFSGIVPANGDIIRLRRTGTTGTNCFIEISQNGGVSFATSSGAFLFNGELYPAVSCIAAPAGYKYKQIKGSSSTVAV